MIRPDIVIHADWGVDPSKRWMARAVRRAGGSFIAQRSERVHHAGRLIAEERSRGAFNASLLLGFDFPIGLPREYAARAGLASFRDFLAVVGHGRWKNFFDVAGSAQEIGLTRPFYPMRPGGTRQAHLFRGLNVHGMDELRRRCELPQPDRRAACSLFWTLGGQQVGKAAISGWREVLLPALGDTGLDCRLWPFDGSLDELIGPGRIVVAETYPSEFYQHLGVRFPKARKGTKAGKRVQRDRAANRALLAGWARSAGIDLAPELEAEIEDGFGSGADGEDRFDAVVGLLGMLNVVLGRRSEGHPRDDDGLRIEGWIMGQSSDF